MVIVINYKYNYNYMYNYMCKYKYDYSYKYDYGDDYNYNQYLVSLSFPRQKIRAHCRLKHQENSKYKH